MKTWLLLVAVTMAVLSPCAAFADYTWNFTADAEGWEAGDTSPGSWGMHGASLAWAPNGAGDGKMVITFDGNYSGTIDDTVFSPALFLFYWNAQSWDDTMGGDDDGGMTGRYCVMRVKINGTEPTVNEGPHWGRMAFLIERGHAGGATMNTVVGSQPLGVWTTVVIDLKEDQPDPATSVSLKLGTSGDGSYAFFQTPGSSIELDYVKFVDDPTPYLSWDFNDGTAPWQDNRIICWNLPGFTSETVSDGIMTATFPDESYSGILVPMLVNEGVWLRSQESDALKTMTPLYMHMRCKVNCDPGLATIPALLLWNESSGFGGPDGDLSDSVRLDIPTNEWTTVTFDISSAPGWGVDDLGWWRSQAFSWAMQLGVNYDGGLNAFPELLGGNIQVDFVEFSDQPITDNDHDGLPNDWETANSLDPNDNTGVNGANGDPDDDGATNLAEFQADTDPQDPDSKPAGMPVAAGLALLATAAGILAYRRRIAH